MTKAKKMIFFIIKTLLMMKGYEKFEILLFA